MRGGMSGRVNIRAATAADARAIVDVHVRSWQWAYRGLIPDEYLDRLPTTIPRRTETWEAWLTNATGEQRTWLAEESECIVGFATTGPTRDTDALPGTGEVSAIYLAPESAGRGIGKMLFAHAVDDLTRRGYEPATLWVLETNVRARRFYEAAGWVGDGTRKSEERAGATLHEVRYRLRRQP